MKKMTFFHAGCPICVSAEQQLLEVVDSNQFEVDVVHLGENKSALESAKQLGVQSVPALVKEGAVFHINFGAALSDLA